MTTEEKVNEALMCENLEIRNEAIVYASKKLNYKNSKIAEITLLTTGTIRNYVKKFIHLLQKAVKRFETIVVNWVKKPTTYIIEFYEDEEMTKLLFLKIGKTKNLNQRLVSLKGGYKKTYGTEKIYAAVRKIYQFEDENDALSFENELRKFYQSKEESVYIKNDRFKNVRYNEKELETNQRLNDSLLFFCGVSV